MTEKEFEQNSVNEPDSGATDVTATPNAAVQNQAAPSATVLPQPLRNSQFLFDAVPSPAQQTKLKKPKTGMRRGAVVGLALAVAAVSSLVGAGAAVLTTSVYSAF